MLLEGVNSHKITAIFLTIVSNVLGLAPFLIDGQDERFWFSFAVGSCGGLLFSIIALIFVLPVFVGTGTMNDER